MLVSFGEHIYSHDTKSYLTQTSHIKKGILTLKNQYIFRGDCRSVNSEKGGKMKYSTRSSDAVHIMIFIHQHDSSTITSADIAKSIQTNPSCVRQIMAQLKAACILLSSKGQATPQLAKATSEITLPEVYKAVEKEKPLLHLDTHTNPECGVGVNIRLALSDFYAQIQKDSKENLLHKNATKLPKPETDFLPVPGCSLSGYHSSGKIILNTKKKMTMDTPPVMTVTRML